MNIIDINNEILRLENENKILDSHISEWTSSRNEYNSAFNRCRSGSRGDECRKNNGSEIARRTTLITNAENTITANTATILSLITQREDALKTAEEVKKSQEASRKEVAAILAQQGKTEVSVLQEAEAAAEAKIMEAKVQADALNETLSIENSNKRRNAMLVAAAILLVLIVVFIIVYKKYIKKK